MKVTAYFRPGEHPARSRLEADCRVHALPLTVMDADKMLVEHRTLLANIGNLGVFPIIIVEDGLDRAILDAEGWGPWVRRLNGGEHG